MDIQPFRIAVPEEIIADLKQRLASTRWPGEISKSGWDYGSNLAYMKELAEYWSSGYDWRAQEEALNRFAHFKARMDDDADGTGIHFIHERGRGPSPLPLVITHGWPSSIYEMTKIIPLLTDPAEPRRRPRRLLRRGCPFPARLRLFRPHLPAGHKHHADRRPLDEDNDRGAGIPAVLRSRG